MRNSTLTTILLVLAIGLSWHCDPRLSPTGSSNSGPLRDSIPGVMKGKADPGFNRNELVVFAKEPLTPQNIDIIKDSMRKLGIDVSLLRIQTCNSCSANIQLWNAPDIYTYVMSEGVRSGSGGGGSNGVGEDSLARYSLNFINSIPVDSLVGVATYVTNYNKALYPVNNLAGKDVIKIAVLDTGIDTVKFIHNSYLWRNEGDGRNNQDDDNNCYKDDVAGWNFLRNDPNFHDDNQNLHGTLIAKYIIDQFQTATRNGVQLLPLKTHDSNGYGSLFAAICALHYAMEKNVQVINASWGFYNYGENPVPYLDSLITQALPAKGILFITAAGNKIAADDAYARALYRATHGGADISPEGLRNLQLHNFYPAILSTLRNNVITTTTTDGIRVSPTQNYSALYVDLAVRAHDVGGSGMRFRVPFDVTSQTISGSSFATAIATGKIASGLKKSLYVPGVRKDVVWMELNSIFSRSPELQINMLVRGGRYINP